MPNYAARPPASHSVQQPVKPLAPPKPIASPTYVPNVVTALQSSPGPQHNNPSAVAQAHLPPPILPPTEPKHWYFNRKGERNGPLRFSELTALITEGSVKPEDYAWSPEIVTWKQIKDVSLFSVYLPKEPPPFEETPTPTAVRTELAALHPEPAALLPVVAPSAVIPVVAKVLPPIVVASPAPAPITAKPAVPIAPASPQALAKPPVVVKSTIGAQSGVQPVGPTASHSATTLQASLTQRSGPTPITKDIFAAVKDPFGAIPNAADFSAQPQREMSALIPISAIRPPLKRRLLVPALVSIAFIAVAGLAYTFGQGTSNQTFGANTKDSTEDNSENNHVAPIINDKAIANLNSPEKNHSLAPVVSELNPTKNVQNPKSKPDNPGETLVTETKPAEVKDPLAEAKAAAEIEKNKDLFGKKTSVDLTIKPVVTPGASADPPTSGSEKIAMEIISDYSGRSQNCVNRSLTNSEFRKETRLNVSISSDKDGKVTAVSVGNAPANSTIETCLKGVYGGLNFKKAGGALNLKFPIIVSLSF
jgi:hypothetical protein